jgi:hypothetical protein
MVGLRRTVLLAVALLAACEGRRVSSEDAGSGGNGSGGNASGGNASGGNGTGGSGSGGNASGGNASGGNASGGSASGGNGTGGAGSGGSTGDAGATDIADGAAPDAGGDGGLAPPRIIRGDPALTFVTIVVVGRGLPPANEDRQVFVRVGTPERPLERLVSAQARIKGGGFELRLPLASEPSLAKRKLLFVDLDGDGVCSPEADRVYGNWDAFTEALATIVLADSSPRGGEGEHWFSLAPGTRATEICSWMNAPWPES